MSDIQDKMFAQRASRELFEQAKKYAFDYIDTVSTRPVYPTEEALSQLAIFDEPLPQQPQSGAEILRLLHEVGSPATVAQTGGRYFGFVNGNAVPTAMAVRWLTDVWDQNSALYVMSPIVAKLEQTCERWGNQLLGLPEETAVGIVSGTSIATLCGLAAGRYALLKKAGWDVNEDGLFGAPPIRVVLSEGAHGTVFKALALLGLGKNRVELVPADDQGRIDVEQMPELDSNTLVILQAGNVNSGSFDNFDRIGDMAQKAGAWIHIDGAFGLWAAASPQLRHLTKGIEKADSWSTDGHKTLNTPYDCALVLCKDRQALISSMQATGAYIQYSEKRDGMLYTPDMSRRARAVELWATLRFLGEQGLVDMLNQLCTGATLFAEKLSTAGFRILNDVVFNQVLVAGATPEETAAILTAVQNSDECWCGGSQWRGEPVIRLSVCSWATTAADVERSVQVFIAARNAWKNSR